MHLKERCPLVLAAVISLSLQAPVLSDDSMGVFDTGTASGVALSGQAVAERGGWSKIAEDKSRSRFKSDLAFSNGRITVVLRKAGAGAELYAHGQEGRTQEMLRSPVSYEAPRH